MWRWGLDWLPADWLTRNEHSSLDDGIEAVKYWRFRWTIREWASKFVFIFRIKERIGQLSSEMSALLRLPSVFARNVANTVR